MLIHNSHKTTIEGDSNREVVTTASLKILDIITTIQEDLTITKMVLK